MDIICTCESCKSRFKVGQHAAGKKARCPKCSAIITIPAAAPSDAQLAATFPPAAVPQAMAPSAAAPEFPPSVYYAPPQALPPSVPSAAPVAPPAMTYYLPPQAAVLPTPSNGPVFPAAVETSTPAPFIVEPAVTATGRPKVSRKKKLNYVPLVIGGGLAVAVLIIGVGVLMFAGGSDTNSQAAQAKNSKKSKAVPTGTLVLDWPEGERRNASMLIDGKGTAIPAKGPIKLKLRPGKHIVGIMRRDYEPVRAEITISQAGSETFRPEWKEAPKIAVAPSPKPSADIQLKPPAETPPPSIDSGTLFVPGSGIAPAGFKGWLQLLPVAKDKAAAEKKDILILIGSSDGNPNTSRLADALRAAGLPGGAFEQRFVPVVIDLPETNQGLNQIVDVGQNMTIAQEYAVESLPLLILADAEGRPYAMQREWPDGVRKAAEIVESLRATRKERDKLLDAANQGDDAQQLDAAVAMLKWIMERRVVFQYRDDVQRWFALAEKLDPKNAGGKLEAALEAELMCQFRDLSDSENLVQLSRMLDVLEPWTKDIRFTDPDRGFRLHFLAGLIFEQTGEADLRETHWNRSLEYKPNDSKLAEQHERVASAMRNRNVLSSGSGFVVAEGGYVVTNRHVVEGRGKVMVRVSGVEEPVSAEVVQIHEKRDLALLKVEFPDSFKPEPLILADEEPSLALEVAAFGYPRGSELGEGLKFASGSISGTPDRSPKNMILLDLRVNPGNSGGPLCNNRGQVVGIVTAKTGGINLDSYGMAIPHHEIEEFLTENLPPSAKRGKRSTEPPGKWNQVAKSISSSVLMILKVR